MGVGQKKNNLQIKEGHARGVSALKEIVKESVNQNIESFINGTVYQVQDICRPKHSTRAKKPFLGAVALC